MGKLDNATFLHGDATEQLKTLEDNSVHACITSPPYFGLRDYHADGQIGLEDSLSAYIYNLTEVFEEVRRVLHPSGSFWLNIGDSYAGSGGPGGDFRDGKGGDTYKRRYDRNPEGLKKKDLCMVPSRMAIALQDEGWWLRSEVIWAKAVSFNDEYSGTCMPESVTDRPTNSHEKLYLLTKSDDYFYDQEAVAEPLADPSNAGNVRGDSGHSRRDVKGANRIRKGHGKTGSKRKLRDVWTFNPTSYDGAHFATYPMELIEPCVKASTSSHGVCSNCGAPYDEEEPTCDCGAEPEPATVLDPFNGAATTGLAALKHGRRYLGIDVNEDYLEISRNRIKQHEEIPTNHSFW